MKIVLPLLIVLVSVSLAYSQFLNPNFATEGIFQYQASGQTWSTQIEMNESELFIGAQDASKQLLILNTDNNGSMDPSFGVDGTVSFPQYNNEQIMDLQISGNNLYALAAHASAFGRYDGYMAKYDKNGTMDMNYGDDGIHYFAYMHARSILPLADGTVLIAGNQQAPADPILLSTLARINPDGTLDESFGFTFELEWGESKSKKIIADASGNIYISGVMNRDFMVAKFDSEGNLDPAFGVGGISLVETLPQLLGTSNDLVMLEDGSMLVCGEQSSSTVSYTTLYKLDATGLLDSLFGKDGVVIEKNINGETFTTARSIQLMGSDKFITSGDNGSTLGLVRYEINGDRDVTFGEMGVFQTTFMPNENSGTDLIIQDSEIFCNVTGKDFTSAFVLNIETEQMSTATENRFLEGTNVYPTVIKDLTELNIDLTVDLRNQDISFRLISQQGALMSGGLVKNGKLSQSISTSLLGGMYYLQLRQGQKQSTHKIIILQ